LRLRLAQEAKGKHFLNLFCYTGVASIHAALGGATTSTSVDLSNTYLQWYRDNLALNGLSERQHRAERSDCLQWLNHCQRRYDLVLLDPPSFSNSKATDNAFDVARDQVTLIDAAMKVLAPAGTLYFSNNRRGFKLDVALLERYQVKDITAETIPEDFSRNTGIHQCWRLQHRQ
jgi:23S rRNA (guanine2445-N2)-methyltransferase / 23S rRNA (guanine2069-N7)-methyltransferase